MSEEILKEGDIVTITHHGTDHSYDEIYHVDGVTRNGPRGIRYSMTKTPKVKSYAGYIDHIDLSLEYVRVTRKTREITLPEELFNV